MPFAFFHFGMKAEHMIHVPKIMPEIISHGVLQWLIVWEIMSEGNGEIVDRDVHSQKSKIEMVNYFQILMLYPKVVLRYIYYSPQSKKSISLEVGEETKLLPDSAILCIKAYKP